MRNLMQLKSRRNSHRRRINPIPRYNNIVTSDCDVSLRSETLRLLHVPVLKN